MAIENITKDVAIIGGGPVGLFAIFELGLQNISACLLDASSILGGQCMQFYPKKMIYDIPGYPKISGEDLINNLEQQTRPFNPQFCLDSTVNNIKKLDTNSFVVETDKEHVYCKAIIIATGAGVMLPNKLNFDTSKFDDRVHYSIQDLDKFKNADVAILGGGDSAIDWTITLEKISKQVTLIHRRKEFKAAPFTLSKVEHLASINRINLAIASIDAIHEHDIQTSDDNMHEQSIDNACNTKAKKILIKMQDKNIYVDHIIVSYGFAVAINKNLYDHWGLDTEKRHINVNIENHMTSIDGVFAIGDVSNYANKSKLILCGFHESAIVSKVIYNRLNPDKKFIQKYTTTDKEFLSKIKD